ncbi:MAG: YicC family protein [Oscillospiraceae bacterium]|nr:YicC family protein [Oscillospiraceae bacterium]
MIKSMTGFGAAKGASGKLEISVEIKSVNNRHFDCSVKIPRIFAQIEEQLKAVAGTYISRGKVDISVFIDSSNADDIEVRANHSLAKEYIMALREIAAENNLSGDIRVADLIRYPDILQVAKREIDADVLGNDIGGILDKALQGFNEMRLREGAKLKDDILIRIEQISKLIELAEEVSPQSVQTYREKLEARMMEILHSSTIDESRILTEVAIFADRVAIDEEIIRLKSHIAQLDELLAQSEPVGRKIDFLLQEINREVNTIGSKGSDPAMSKIVVALKSEIEKIREQAQNIE